MVCPKCNAEIDGQSYYCNRCGAAQEQAQPPGEKVDSGATTYLFFSLACFAWAVVRGIYEVIVLVLFVVTEVGDGGRLGMDDLYYAAAPAGWNFVLPLILGLVLLIKHLKDARRKNANVSHL